MKIDKLGIILFVFFLSSSIFALAKESKSPISEVMLDGLDAREAVALANLWRWTRKDITSFVTTREVVFKFPSGNSKRIQLPKNEILVAIAPYINNTHD